MIVNGFEESKQRGEPESSLDPRKPKQPNDRFQNIRNSLNYKKNLSKLLGFHKEISSDNEHHIPLIDYLNLPKLERSSSTPATTSPTFNLQDYKSFPFGVEQDSYSEILVENHDDEGTYSKEFEGSRKKKPTIHFDNTLVRTYSDNDRDRFNYETGQRHDIEFGYSLADAQTATNATGATYQFGDKSARRKRYLQYEGMEDEYIPDFSFKDSLKSFDLKFSDENKESQPPTLLNVGVRSKTSLPQRSEASVISELHSEVEPIKIRDAGTFSRIDAASSDIESYDIPPLTEKLSIDDNVFKLANSPERDGDKFYLSSIPSNFSSMSFSERYKLLNDVLPDNLKQDSKYKSHLTKLIRATSSSSIGSPSRPRSVSSATSSPIAMSSSSPAFQFLYGGSNSNSRRNSVIETNTNERGSLVMGYVLGNVIGSGAWGVIRAVEKASENPSASIPSVVSADFYQPKAMKIIKINTSESIRERFLQEIEVWGLLKHENILCLIDWTQTSNYIFALTYRIKGGSLFELVKFWGRLNSYYVGNSSKSLKENNTEGDNKKEYPTSFENKTKLTLELKQSKSQVVSLRDRLKRIRVYSIDILKGLKYMHEQNIVHGDIKLENCLIQLDEKTNHFERILLCDFGMSKIISSSTGNTSLSGESSEATSLSSSNSNTVLSLPLLPTSIMSSSCFANKNIVKKLLINPNHHLGPSPASISFHSVKSDAQLSSLVNNSDANNNSTEEHPSLHRANSAYPKLGATAASVSHLEKTKYARGSSTALKSPNSGINVPSPLSSDLSGRRHPRQNGSRATIFGLGTEVEVEGESELTSPDQHIGSLPYSPPEVLLPNPPDLNKMTDMWSFGVLFYSLLIGKLPFMHTFEPRLRLMIINGFYETHDINNLLELYSFLADDESVMIKKHLHAFEKVIFGCLEKDVTRRLSAEKALEVLNNI